MTFSNFIRRNGFWILDKIKGGCIRNHYKEISLIQENFDAEYAQELLATYLSNLLNHATSTVPYYRKYNGKNRLEHFPVVDKITIQKEYKEFYSSEYTKKHAYKIATSGSTGVPFTLYQNQNKRLRNTADTLYFMEQANYRLGEKLYDLEVWRNINMNNPVKAKFQNLVYLDISIFSENKIKEFLRKLKQHNNPVHLIGFTSAFENICSYLDRIDSAPLQLNVKSIIAISEYLTPHVKERMQYFFQVPVVSRYSSEEVGIVAQQKVTFETSDFQLNRASYHIEILDINQNIPARPGELGRIVITDFFNYCMPLIRYDTGDVAILGDQVHNGPSTLKRIEGRKMDVIYNTNGELISSFLVYTKFHKYYDMIKQYQFIQEDHTKYLIKLNIKESFPYEQQLIQSFKEDFGEDANISIEYVDEIPTLSSGKRKKVLSLVDTV